MGVPTAILAQRYAAGESIDELASDYECDRLKIEEAIRYELARSSMSNDMSDAEN